MWVVVCGGVGVCVGGMGVVYRSWCHRVYGRRRRRQHGCHTLVPLLLQRRLWRFRGFFECGKKQKKNSLPAHHSGWWSHFTAAMTCYCCVWYHVGKVPPTTGDLT